MQSSINKADEYTDYLLQTNKELKQENKFLAERAS